MGSNVVDYAAWQKGYMPPTEHILIDQLAYRGAKVIMSSDMGDCAYWLVVRDFQMDRDIRWKITEALTEAICDAWKEKRHRACIAKDEF